MNWLSLPMLRDVVDSDRPGNREVVLKLKDKAHLLGLTLQDVVGQVRQGFFGLESQRVQRGEDEVKIWVRYAEDERASLRDLEDMRIRTADGRQLPLSELVSYHIERGIRAISHLDGKREVRVEADLANSAQSATDATTTCRLGHHGAPAGAPPRTQLQFRRTRRAKPEGRSTPPRGSCPSH